MPTVKVRNLKNKEVGDLELSDAVFGAEYNEGLVHAAVKNFLANARAGTVGTKTRGDVSGSGKKLWKQKGTGRARIASIRSPLWKGGGNVHGPQARDWSYSLPKKMRRGALRSAFLTTTTLPFAPGTAPRTMSRLFSTSTRATVKPLTVTRSSPMCPEERVPLMTRDG